MTLLRAAVILALLITISTRPVRSDTIQVTSLGGNVSMDCDGEDMVVVHHWMLPPHAHVVYAGFHDDHIEVNSLYTTLLQTSNYHSKNTELLFHKCHSHKYAFLEA